MTPDVAIPGSERQATETLRNRHRTVLAGVLIALCASALALPFIPLAPWPGWMSFAVTLVAASGAMVAASSYLRLRSQAAALRRTRRSWSAQEDRPIDFDRPWREGANPAKADAEAEGGT